jgi:alpha-mannosidase
MRRLRVLPWFRNAMAGGLLFPAALAVGAAETNVPVNLEREPVLYLVGYAHLDTQWRWTYPLTIGQLLPHTVQANLPLFAKYPHYIFNFSGANRYRMIQEYYPAQFELVRQQVAAGQWFPCGSSWEENDVNVPACESIIRQVLLGHRFFKRNFGAESCEYMLPDCFGFPASLPSILAHCGLRGFSTQKLSWHCAVGIPFDIGTWEGPDGQSVIAVFNPGSYGAKIRGNLVDSPNLAHLLEIEKQTNGLSAYDAYYGTGDVGGAPDEESVASVEASATATGKVRVISARADQLFRDITDAQKARFPKYKGDLLLTEHSAGSISSQAAMKQWNRKNELLADAAERAAVVAHWLGAAPYPREKLAQAWGLVLGGQFHDILPGTSHPWAYCFSWNDEVIAMNCFAEVLKNSVGAASRALDTQVEGVPMVVFNPLSIEREDVVEAGLDAMTNAAGLQIFDPAGAPLPTQIITNGANAPRLLFSAKAPPLGFAVFSLKNSAATNRPSELRVTERSLENGRYRVKVDDRGDLSEIFDKQLARNLLASPARLAFLRERPAEWPAWNMDWADRQLRPSGYVDGPPQVRIVEDGPVRVALEIRRTARASVFVQTVRLAAGAAGQRIEIVNHIEWQTPESSLKAVFDLSVTNPLATYNWELGKIQRGNNNPVKYEVPTHYWLDLTDTNGQSGVTILTGAKYGSDKPSDNALRLTLLFTPGVTDKFVEQGTQDWGVHDFTYGIYSHAGNWQKGGSDWQAARQDQPLLAFRVPAHAGPLGRSFSLLRPSSDQLAVRAVKLAEDSDEVMVRVQELGGEPVTKAKIEMCGAIKSAREVSGIEQPLRALPSGGKELAVDFTPFQLRTLALALESPVPLAGPVCRPVDLPFNTNLFTSNSAGGPVMRPEPTIPAEMMADNVVSEGIRFQIGPRQLGAPNAVACAGQTVPLPPSEKPFNRLYVLLMSMSGDTEAEFLVGARTNRVRVQEGSGFIGQWDNRVFEGPVAPVSMSITNPVTSITPGFIKRAPLAWFCSHRHGLHGEDRPYEFSYLFKLALDCTAETKTLTLPNKPGIRVLAVTLTDDPNDLTRPLGPLYDDFTGRPALSLSTQKK